MAEGRSKMPLSSLLLGTFARPPIRPSSRCSAALPNEPDITRPTAPTVTITPIPISIEKNIESSIMDLRSRATACRGTGNRPRSLNLSIVHAGEKYPRKVVARVLQPVHERGADARRDELAEGPPLGSTPTWRKAKISCMMIVSPSMPTTSEMLVTLRGPPCNRLACKIRSMAEANWRAEGPDRQLQPGHADHGFEPAHRVAGGVGVDGGHRTLVAGIHGLDHVERLGARHSPMMIRSGRIRRAFFTRSVAVMAPRPSMLAGRVSSRTTWSC